MDVTTIEDLLATGRPVLLDGAWGTELQRRGLPTGACPDAWNHTRPETVREVAAAYVAAGSRIILTNTFGANRVTLAPHGLADRAADINRAGAEISRSAAEGRALVFGSMGPSGKLLLMEEIRADVLEAAFVEQADALARGGVDGIAVETMTDLEEAMLALRAARATGLPVAVSMVFDHGGRSMMGVTPADFAARAAAGGAVILGSNCGCGPEGFAALCTILREAGGGRPVWAKPNAGLPRLRDGQACWDMTPAAFAEAAGRLPAAGAALVGGCCGTTPDHLRTLGDVLQASPRE